MDRYRLKNIIIIILLLMNFFLLGSLAIRKTSDHSSQVRTEEQLVELFAADSMFLDGNAISSEIPPSSLSLTRNTERERNAAAFFLGKGLTWNEQSGVYTYSSSSGAAVFRSSGSFDIGGTLSDANAEELCQKFCETFSYDELTFILDENGSGTGTAVCRYSKLPVFNGAVTFTIDQGILVSVSGTLLPESGTVTNAAQTPLSATAALTVFHETRRKTSAVVSSVTDMYLCYELQSTTAAPMFLVPTWCIMTDTNEYYVNCITSTVTTG